MEVTSSSGQGLTFPEVLCCNGHSAVSVLAPARLSRRPGKPLRRRAGDGELRPGGLCAAALFWESEASGRFSPAWLESPPWGCPAAPCWDGLWSSTGEVTEAPNPDGESDPKSRARSSSSEQSTL